MTKTVLLPWIFSLLFWVAVAVVWSMVSSCGIEMKPVAIKYKDPKTGIIVTEKVGDGVFGPVLDLSEVELKDKALEITPAK